MGTVVTRDGQDVSPVFETEQEAARWLLRHQGQSVDWATRYEGYGFRTVSDEEV